MNTSAASGSGNPHLQKVPLQRCPGQLLLPLPLFGPGAVSSLVVLQLAYFQVGLAEDH
jgi:hypothetical protein